MVKLTTEDFPVLEWGNGFAFLARSPKQLSLVAKSEFARLQRMCLDGHVRLITATGFTFHVLNMNPTHEPHVILDMFRSFRAEDILSEGRQIDLKEFKRRVEWAVRERQKGDYDVDFMGPLRLKLAAATTYREAIDAVPRNM
jgi:hypothetical protein